MERNFKNYYFYIIRGYQEEVWKQKNNYTSDKFYFSIHQLEFIGELDALKYTGFKEYVTERMAVQSYNPLLTLQDIISYLRFQSMYPVIEQLCKRGFSTTLTDEIHHRLAHGNSFCIDFSCKKITDALAIPERLIKIYLKDNDSSFRLKHFQALYRIDENVREEDIDWIDLHGVYDDQIGAVIEESPMSIMRVCEYLEHVRINQCYEPKNAIIDWRDYLKAAKTIEVDLTDNKAKYPSSLKREHDRAIAKQKVILDSKKDEIFKAETEEYGRLYSHKDKNFMIIPPKDMKDLFEEGRKLNHCVGSYSDRIIQGNTCIMFVREVEEPDKPYFTIKISRSSRHIVQLRANSNRLINHSSENELVKFLRDWAKKKNLAINIATLNKLDFFIHLCCHLYKEATTLPWVEMKRDMTLYKYADIYMLLDNMSEVDVSDLFDRAKELELEKICAFAILQTAELFESRSFTAEETAGDILQSDPDFLHRVISPAEKKTYIYKTKDIAQRFFMNDRVADLEEVMVQ